MSYKLKIILMIIQSVASTRSQEPFATNPNRSVMYLEEVKFDCDLSISTSMNFIYNQRCVQFVFGSEESATAECVAKIMRNAQNITFIVRSMSWLLNRNVYKEESTENILKGKSIRYCENFLIFLENVSSLTAALNTATARRTVSVSILFPFSKLHFVLADKTYEFSQSEISQISAFFYENSHFGYLYEMDEVSKKIKLRDLLSFDYVDHHNETARTNLIHPFVNRENNEKEFRISFHQCYPYVIYVDEDNLRFDGVEYRLVQQVIKNWKVKYIMRDESKTSISPWITMFEDLINHTADIAMCSVWLTEYENRFDLSTYHQRECTALLVPKPKKLSEITAIYTTLSSQIWLLFAMCFAVTGLLMWTSARMGTVQTTVYVNFSRTFLDLINITTSHGVGYFPRQHSIKLLLMSWTFLSLWIGICYTTVYTSRLTSPGYTKLVDTIADFVASDMLWTSLYNYEDAEKSLNASDDPDSHELLRRFIIVKNQDEVEACLKSGKYGVYAGITSENYFVTYDWNDQLQLLKTFRLMKKVCIFNFYSVFALQRFSPYTELFSEHALMFQEYGFSKFWYGVVYRDKEWFRTFFEDYPKETKEPKSLHLASVSGAILILLVSHILSLLVFVCEIVLK